MVSKKYVHPSNTVQVWFVNEGRWPQRTALHAALTRPAAEKYVRDNGLRRVTVDSTHLMRQDNKWWRVMVPPVEVQISESIHLEWMDKMLLLHQAHDCQEEVSTAVMIKIKTPLQRWLWNQFFRGKV